MESTFENLLLVVFGGLLIFGGLLTWSESLPLAWWTFPWIVLLGCILLICGVILVFLAIERFAFRDYAKRRKDRSITKILLTTGS